LASTVTSLAAGLLRGCGIASGPPPPQAANSNAGAMQSARFMGDTVCHIHGVTS
jgi:hypothetical protein